MKPPTPSELLQERLNHIESTHNPDERQSKGIAEQTREFRETYLDADPSANAVLSELMSASPIEVIKQAKDHYDEDVRLLIDALDTINNAARLVVLTGEGIPALDEAQGGLDKAIADFTEKGRRVKHYSATVLVSTLTALKAAYQRDTDELKADHQREVSEIRRQHQQEANEWRCDEELEQKLVVAERKGMELCEALGNSYFREDALKRALEIAVSIDSRLKDNSKIAEALALERPAEPAKTQISPKDFSALAETLADLNRRLALVSFIGGSAGSSSDSKAISNAADLLSIMVRKYGDL